MRSSPVLLIALLSGCSVDFDVVEPDVYVPEPPVEVVEQPVEDPEVPPEEPPAVDTAAPEPTVEEDPIPQAQAPVYANTSETLYEVSPSSGATREIGSFHLPNGTGVDGIVDIAIDHRGRLFAGDRGSNNKGPFTIWRVDPLSAEVSKVCEVGVQLMAMAFTSEGLLVVGDVGDLVTIDVDHGCTRDTLFESDWETSGDLVGLPDGLLYWTVRDDDGDGLVVVDPRTGLAGYRGNVRFDRLYGLGFDEPTGTLYGFSADGEIVQIDPGGGQGSLLSEQSDFGWWGATTNPVVWQ